MLLSGAAVTWPLAVDAQQPGESVLLQGRGSTNIHAFRRPHAARGDSKRG